MEFRWVAVIAVWTLLSGPVFSPSGGSSGPSVKVAASSAAKTPAARTPAPVR